MKQRIERLLHSIGCVVCNPITRARRRRALRRVRDNAHIMWADTLAQDVRRDRIRAVMADVGGEPWQIDYLTALLDRPRGQTVAVMPPQHPQTLQTLMARNFARLVEQAENEARKRLPVVMTQSEYDALDPKDPNTLYAIKADSA